MRDDWAVSDADLDRQEVEAFHRGMRRTGILALAVLPVFSVGMVLWFVADGALSIVGLLVAFIAFSVVFWYGGLSMNGSFFYGHAPDPFASKEEREENRRRGAWERNQGQRKGN